MDATTQKPQDGQAALYEKLARKALASYGLEDAELWFLGQSANAVFRVQTDDGRWALRICNPGRDHAILTRELLWLVALSRDTDLAVPEPVIMRTGDLFRSVSMLGLSGFRACLLFRWVKGQFAQDVTEDQAAALGVLTAKLHRHAEGFRWPEEVTPTQTGPEVVGGNIPRQRLKAYFSDDATDDIRSTIPAIQKAMEQLGTGSDVAGVIHGDLHQANVLFQDGVAGAIDFECVQWNHYAYDIATSLGYLKPLPSSDALSAAYIRGYESIRSLPCDLDEHVPAFEILRSFTMIAWILNTPRLLNDDWGRRILDGTLQRARQFLDTK